MELDRVPGVVKYLSVVMLFSYLGRSAVWFFLPIYIEKQIASVFLVGVITSLPAAVPVILDIPVSNLVQRVGEKSVILAGLLVSLSPGLFYLLAQPLFLVLGKFSEGLAKVMIWNGGWSLSLRTSDEEVESETASIFLLGINLSTIIGPVFGGFVLAQAGFPPLFYIWSVTVGIGLVVFYHYIGAKTEANFVNSLEKLFERSTYLEEVEDFEESFSKLRKPLSLVFLYSILLSFNWLVIPLLLDKMGADPVTMGIIFGLAGLPWIFQFGWASLADKLGHSKVLAVLAILAAPILFYVSLLDQIIMLAAFFIFSKVLLSGFSPAIHAIFDARVSSENEGEMTGFLEFFKHIGQAAGPIMAGAVSSVYGLNTTFVGAGIIAVLISILALRDF